MDTDLSRDINYIRGPAGQVVVVVRPNQRGISEMQDFDYNASCIICAVYWGILAFSVGIVGFSLTCVGISYLIHNEDNPVLLIGSILFGIGLFAFLMFVIVMCCMTNEHQSQIQRYMHRDTPGELQPMIQPGMEDFMTQPSTEDFYSSMSPYQRFMMLRGSEGASPDTSFSGQMPGQQSSSSGGFMWPLQTNTSGTNTQMYQHSTSPV